MTQQTPQTPKKMTNNSTHTDKCIGNVSDACPHCGCQTKDPFGMGKTIHNVKKCKRNSQLAELKAEVERLCQLLGDLKSELKK